MEGDGERVEGDGEREMEMERVEGEGKNGERVDGEGKDGERGEGTVTHGTKPIDMFTVNRFSVTNYSRGEKPSTHKQ